MEVIKHMFRDLRRVNNKKALVAAVFGIAVVAALGLGFATRGGAGASSIRDTGHNPIINTGSIGCLTAAECVADMKKNNPSDLKDIYANFGLAPSDYANFEKNARLGITTRDGKIIVDGQVVATNAWSTGRDKFGKDTRIAYQIKGKTYYKSLTKNSFAAGVNSIDTLVLFNADGTVKTAVMTACGNPTWGTNEVPKYSCDKLNKAVVPNKKNTWAFSTNATALNNAKIVQVEYDFGDGTKQIVKNPKEVVQHTYAMPKVTTTYTAKVRVLIQLPGNNKKIVEGINCKTAFKIEVPPPKPTPSYACTNLGYTKLDDKNQKFGFSVKISYANGPVPLSADFIADGVKTAGVTTKDAQGNFYKEYTFTDTADHKVSAVVHFTLDSKDVVTTEKCEATVNSQKTPMCEIPGKENFPPNAPECQEECKPGIPKGDDRCNPTPPEECKPGVPVGDARCEDVPPVTPPEECKPGIPVGSADCEEQVGKTPPAEEMPNTGAGSIAGLFAGTSVLGAASHRLYKRFSRKG